MAQVVIQEGGKGEEVAGVWVTCSDNSCVALVAEEKVGPYLAIFPPDRVGLPAIAISAGDGDAEIQLSHDGRKAQVVSLSQLVIAMRKLASLE